MDDCYLRVWEAAILTVVYHVMSFNGVSAGTTAVATTMITTSNSSWFTAAATVASNSSTALPPPNDDGGCRGRGNLPCGALIGIIIGVIVGVIILIIIVVVVIRTLQRKSIEDETGENETSEYDENIDKRTTELQVSKSRDANQMPEFPAVTSRRSNLPPLALSSKEPDTSYNERNGRPDKVSYLDDGTYGARRALPRFTASTSFDADVDAEDRRRRKQRRMEEDDE